MIHTPRLGRRGAGCAAFGLLAACAANPPAPPVVLPPDPTAGLADPGRQAILHTAHAFATPGSMAGQPWVAAQAISEAEFLVVDLNTNQRWIEISPLAKMAFEQARPEWRGALGIDPAAAPQAVIDGMTRVRLAYGAQNPAAAAAALQPPLFSQGGQATLARLSELPPLPRTARAAMMTQEEMLRMHRRDQRNDWP